MAFEPSADANRAHLSTEGDRIETRKRAGEVSRLLRDRYPDTTPILQFGSPFELLVAVMLSAQTTDRQVNLVTPELFARYPDPEALAQAPLSDLERILHSTGFFRSKAKNVRATAREIVTRHNGKVPREMETLVTLPGVGRKSANVVRGVLFDLPAVIVDTHFKRVVGRIGLSAATTPEGIEREIGSLISPAEQFRFSMAANNHGRQLCTARKPRCTECPIRSLCDYGRIFLS